MLNEKHFEDLEDYFQYLRRVLGLNDEEIYVLRGKRRFI